MGLEFGIDDIATFTKTISDHFKLANYFKQLDTKQLDTLNQLAEIVSQNDISRWRDINTYVVRQVWGNTSGGWQSIGGAAMTADYTIVIENLIYGVIFVYYGGSLAYIAKIDDNLSKYRQTNYSRLPGLGSCAKDLTLFYKARK